jgi:ABC-type dipeptide/oligopeptide/nickel transport system permease subunit
MTLVSLEQSKRRKIKEFLANYKSDKKGVIGLTIILLMIFVALAAPYISPYDPREYDIKKSWSPPSLEHILGTNDIGQDILSQVLYGARVSILVGVLSATFTTFIGTFIGIIAGYSGRPVDDILTTLTDIVLIIPSLPLLIILAAYLRPSVWNIVLVIAMVGWPSIARVVRSRTLQLKERVFVEAARALGGDTFFIISKHILPHVFSVSIVYIILSTIAGIIAEASLSFLGLGDPTVISWGIMLYYANTQGALLRGAWWWIVPPGAAIALNGLGFLFVGQTLDKIFNPRLRGYS